MNIVKKKNESFYMIKEKSSGAIIYKICNQTLYFLIIKQTLGHFSFPKGHIENGENEEEAAIREIREETGYDVILDIHFKEVNSYSPSEGVIKEVVFFIGEVVSGIENPQKEEVSDISWYSYENARKVLTYESDIFILDKAYQYIVKNKMNSVI